MLLILTFLYKFVKTNAFVHLWLYSPCGPSPLFQFFNLCTVGRAPWTRDQPVARPLPTLRTTNIQNKRTHTSIPRVGLEPAIPLFERAKTVHALDCEATVIGNYFLLSGEISH
jgi:hypothetical protein